jgi:hypothetical protein
MQALKVQKTNFVLHKSRFSMLFLKALLFKQFDINVSILALNAAIL